MHSRKAVGRLYVNKAHMMSIGHALTEQLGESWVEAAVLQPPPGGHGPVAVM